MNPLDVNQVGGMLSRALGSHPTGLPEEKAVTTPWEATMLERKAGRALMRFASVAAVVFAVGCGGPAPPPYKPIADGKQLFQGIFDPSSDLRWELWRNI